MSYLDQDQSDAPDVQQLWMRTHTARKAGRTCQACKEPIEPGQRYESWGNVIDGVFEQSIHHADAYRYPSGCPKQNEIDRKEAEEQFTKDQAMWNEAVR